MKRDARHATGPELALVWLLMGALCASIWYALARAVAAILEAIT